MGVCVVSPGGVDPILGKENNRTRKRTIYNYLLIRKENQLGKLHLLFFASNFEYYLQLLTFVNLNMSNFKTICQNYMIF